MSQKTVEEIIAGVSGIISEGRERVTNIQAGIAAFPNVTASPEFQENLANIKAAGTQATTIINDGKETATRIVKSIEAARSKSGHVNFKTE